MKKIISLSLLSILVLTGCKGFQLNEKQSFIDATVEATCMILQAEDLLDPKLEEQTKEIYKKYGFDADDETKMEELTAKYADDAEVTEAVREAVQRCATTTVGAESVATEETETAREDDATLEATAEESEETTEATTEETEPTDAE